MECKFWVGQKVVCVPSDPVPGTGTTRHAGEAVPHTEDVYTIREVLICPWRGVPSVRLVEIVNPPHFYQTIHGGGFFGEATWPHSYFRPATDISIFHDIVAKVKTGNRDLVPAGAMR